MTDHEFDALRPSIFSIETVLGCSLRCPECAVGGGLIERPKGVMTFDQFKTIADKIRPYAKYLYLHVWGEPLLNKDIVRMIRYASPWVKTNISTHGQHLPDHLAEELITSDLTDLLVSIDGFTQDVYARYRVQGSVTKALHSLALLQSLNRKHARRPPIDNWFARLAGGTFARPETLPVNIMPQFIVFHHNQHEMAAFDAYCRALRLKPTFKAPYLRPNSRFQVGDDPRYHRTRYLDRSSLRRAMRGCSSPRQDFTILVDGSVVVCCYDHQGATTLGNIFQQDVIQIWNSPRSRAFRRDLIEGRTPDFCTENCLMYAQREQPAPLTALTVGSMPI